MPNTPILLTKAAVAFPNGGRAGFVSWLKNRCTITHTESIEHHHGVDAVWRKFSSVFTILNTIIFYEPIFRKVRQPLFMILTRQLISFLVYEKNDAAIARRWREMGRSQTRIYIPIL